MESIIWNSLNLWFKNNPVLLVVAILIILFFWKVLPYWWKHQTGKFKDDYEAKEHTRASINEIKTDVTEIRNKVTLINGSIQKHHSDEDCHFKKVEYLEQRKEDLERLAQQFSSMEKINLRILEGVLEMKKQRTPRKADV